MADPAALPHRPAEPTVSSLAGLDQLAAVVQFSGPDPAPRHGSLRPPAALAHLEAQAELALGELARVELQVNDRLERRAERAARSAVFDRGRQQAFEAQLQGATALMATTAARAEARLQALEERTRHAEAELSDLGEMQAALDGGLGRLRAELTALRPAAALPTPERPGDRRDLSARSAEANAQLDAVSEATDDLLRQRQRQNARLAALEKAVASAVAASARASSRRAEIILLRDDVDALRQQLATQQEALESLRKSVDRLGRRR